MLAILKYWFKFSEFGVFLVFLLLWLYQLPRLDGTSNVLLEINSRCFKLRIIMDHIKKVFKIGKFKVIRRENH